MARDSEVDCRCPFSQETGREGDAANIGLVYGQDPPTCLNKCREAYLRKISDNPDISPEACNILLTSTNRQEFHPLYWCDSSLCGVWINPGGGLEQDPNVGLIINTCQNIGDFTINDTGPPPENYSCSFCDDGSNEDPGPAQKSNLSATPSTKATSGSAPAQPTSTPGISRDASQSATQPTTVPSPAVQSSTTNAVASSTGKLGVGAKVAIGVCSVTALLALAILMLLFLRHRQKSRPYSPARKERINISHDLMKPPPGSPTPLISPVSTSDIKPPLTPPLRLQDRKLLPSFLKSSGPSDSLTFGYSHDQHDLSQIDKPPFPVSPICAPTTNKLEPRQAKISSSHKHSSLRSPPPVSFSMPRSSLSSFATSGTVTANSSLRNEIMATMTNETGASTIAVAESVEPTPPPSPTRLLRPHTSPLVIPDSMIGSVTPGTPPNRGLPPPPPLSPPPLRGKFGSVYSLSFPSSSRDGEVSEPPAVATQVSKDDGCDQANHDSWGSWTNTGDDNLGMAGSDAYTEGIGIALTKTHSSEVLPDVSGLRGCSGPGVEDL